MKRIILLCCLGIYLTACSKDETIIIGGQPDFESDPTKAEVVSVSFTTANNQTTFTVTVKSPDTGCEQYADWWEVVTPDGQLLQRRILAHSHVTEQPFSRSAEPVEVARDQEIYIRAHMNTNGYGTTVQRGSLNTGFSSFKLENFEFDESLQNMDPLPTDCAF